MSSIFDRPVLSILFFVALSLAAIGPHTLGAAGFVWTLGDPAPRYGLVNLQAGMALMSRDFPTANAKSLKPIVVRAYVAPFSFLSVGVGFRGFMSYQYGTLTTSVRSSINEYGINAVYHPIIFEIIPSVIDLRAGLHAGLYISSQKVTYTHAVVEFSSLTQRTNIWVVPVELSVESIFWNRYQISLYGGYTLFAQARGIYFGASLGVFFF